MEKVYIKNRFDNEKEHIIKNIEKSINKNEIGFTHLYGESGIGRTSALKEVYNDLIIKYKESNVVIIANETPIGKFNVSELQPYKLIGQAINNLKDSKKISAEKKLAINAGISLLSAIPVIGEVPYAFKALSNDWQMYKLEKLGSGNNIKDSVELDFISALESYAKQKPLLILIDDLQWSDKPSIELLISLSKELENYPIHIIFTSKKINITENQIYADLLKFLEKTDINYNKLELQTFNIEQVSRFCSHFDNNYSKNQEFLDWIFKKTNGNPSYLMELMRYFKRSYPFDNEGNLKINLKSEVYLSLDADQVLENINEIFDIEERQILSICSCEGRTFSAYMVSVITQNDILTTIKKLKAIQAKSDIIQSKGMEIIYGVKTTTYEFTQSNYFQYFDSLLEYEERISIHSQIAKELQDRLNNTTDEKLKELLVPYIAAHSAEAENTQLYNEMVEINHHQQVKYGLAPSLIDENTQNTIENASTNANGINAYNPNTSNINGEYTNNSSQNGFSNISLFSEFRKNLVNKFEGKLFNQIINDVTDYTTNHKIVEDEKLQLNAFVIRSYTELGEYNKAKELIDLINKKFNNNFDKIKNPVAECMYLNSIAMYYIEQKKYNQAFDILKNAAKKSLKLPNEMKLMTMMNIYNLLKITSPDKSVQYKNLIDKIKNKVQIQL